MGRRDWSLTGLIALSACGGSGPSGPSGNGAGSISATINGTAWVADSRLVQFPTPGKQGHYPLYGAKTVGTTVDGIQLNLVGISAPGTYPLGTGGGVAGGTGSVNEGSAAWLTPVSGSAGSVTITTLTSTRIAGTFQFVAEAVPGLASGTRTVTNGQFDISFSLPANLPALAHSDTGSMSATIGGEAWNGASGAGGAPVNQSLLVVFTGTTRTVSISLVPYTGPGTYTLGAANTFHRVNVNAGTVAGSPCCWGGRTNAQGILQDVGTVTITSATANRIRGTFSATLAPALSGSAVTNLTIANGTFSYGFP